MAIKVADTFIAVGGDLTGYRKSLGTAKTEAMGLGQQLRQALTNPAGFGGSSKLAGLVADLKLGRNATAAIKDAASGLGTTLKGLSVNALHSGLNGIKTVLGGLKGLASDVFKGFSIGLGIGSFQALGRAISDVVEFIPNLVDRGREYLRTVDDIADATGAGAVETSKFVSTLMFLGVPLNGIINMLGQASRNLELMGPRLEALGIQVHNSNGAWLNQIQILNNARQAMSEWGAGSKKVDILAREFGRGGLKTLVDFLNLTDEQFKRITDDAQSMGLIVTEQQRNLGEAAVREGARFQNVLTGLGTALFTAVGPSIMAFFSNLTETIVANMEKIKTAISGAINFIIGAASSLLGLSGSLDSFSASIEDANAVTSPYSSDIIDLTDQITKLGDGTDAVKDATNKATAAADAQRKSIQKNIDTIDKETSALQALEKQQDKTYKKALAGILAVLGAQEQLLDAEDKAAQRAQTDLDLTERLRQAKIDLFEAQAQLRADVIAGVSTDKDTLDIQDRTRAVLDAQKAISEEARNRAEDDRRAEITATKDYIESIQKLLEDADNKKAALNTLRRREAVLAARQQAQLAAGDTTGAGDTGLKLEAIRTTETRAQEEIRNGIRQTALDKQKALLQAELSNVKTAAVDATAIKKGELEKQLAALIAHEIKWKKIHDEETRLSQLLGRAIGSQRTGSTGGGGATPSIVDAINAARDAGVEWGKSFKGVLSDFGTLLGGIVGFLDKIVGLLGVIGKNPVWKLLTTELGGTETTDSRGRKGFVPRPNPGQISVGGGVVDPNGIADAIITRLNDLFGTNLPVGTRAEGGYTGNGLYRLHDREYVVDRSLSAKLERALTGPQMAWAGATPDSGTLVIEKLTIDFGDRAVDLLDQKLAYRRRR